VVKCEIKQISDIENIPSESIYYDTKIMEFSCNKIFNNVVKWKKKVEEYKRAIFAKFCANEQ
jgi:hypothetical protein